MYLNRDEQVAWLDAYKRNPPLLKTTQKIPVIRFSSDHRDDFQKTAVPPVLIRIRTNPPLRILSYDAVTGITRACLLSFCLLAETAL